MIRAKVGLLVPYVPFYEKIAPVRAEKLRFATDLKAALADEFDVVGGLVESEDEAARIGREFGAEVDGVLVVPTVAAFGALGWAALKQVAAPVCLWSVQPDGCVPEDYDIRALIRNSGGLGIQALANTLARAGRHFRVIWSGGCDGVPGGVREWARASALASRLRRARFGCIGSTFPQMTDVAFDSRAWDGAELRHVTAEEFAGQCVSQTQGSVDARMQEMRSEHPIADLTDDSLARSARLSLALDAVVREHALDGGAFNCHGANCLQDPRMGVTACYAVSRQTSQGRPFSCTGDIPTAIALWILHQLADVVMYGELDMVDPGRNFLLLANGGEGHFDAAGGGAVTLTGNENFEGVHGRGAALQFEPFEGPATILSFTPLDDGRYRCIAAEGDLMRVRLQLRVFHAAFRCQGLSAKAAFELWCESGAVHHIALAPGRWSRILREMAEIRGFEYRQIGNSE